jgi:hypothetical protein
MNSLKITYVFITRHVINRDDWQAYLFIELTFNTYARIKLDVMIWRNKPGKLASWK